MQSLCARLPATQAIDEINIGHACISLACTVLGHIDLCVTYVIPVHVICFTYRLRRDVKYSLRFKCRSFWQI
jgi:hypothetical protein